MPILKEILNTLERTAKENKLSRPWIVGGVVRDKLLNRLEAIEDFDITTGNDDVHELARLFAGAYPKSDYRIMRDGHAQVRVETFKIDFSSDYRAPSIEKMLKKVGHKSPSDMLMELLSRDFTCNSLIMSLDLQNIEDPTGLGLTDIKRKRLRTCLPAKFTLKNDNKRVVRILYLAAKLGFEVDNEIINWVRTYPESIANVKPRYLSGKLQEALNYDKDKTVKLLDAMNLWKHIPILEDLMPYMTVGRI